MTNEYVITLFLDTRRKKNSGKFPVKLRVYSAETQKKNLYPTKFEFTEEEFKSIYETVKPRKEHREIRLLLTTIQANAEKAAASLPYFTFEGFENAMFSGGIKVEKDVSFYYLQAIETYKKNKQHSTAENYSSSLKSLLEFNKRKNLNFKDISPQWLKDYESYSLQKGKSKTTIGIYLRPLRAIFNTAIQQKVIVPDVYPFGKRKYSIPAPKGVKKALAKEQLKTLFEATPCTPEQEKAKAFWFFSYSCNGMNLKDIANLRFKDISGDVLTFSRAKTSNTNRAQAPVIVYLNEYTLSIIEKYGNTNKAPDNYIFSITDTTKESEKQHAQLKNFVRYVNQHFLKFAKNVGINESVSTYWARHSFATSAIRSGASLEYVSEALSHSNLKTTIGYFAGFPNETKREISNKLMDF